MKRLTDKELLKVMLNLPNTKGISDYAAEQDTAVPPGSYFKIGVSAQLQADKEAVEKCREKIAKIIENALMADLVSGQFGSSPYADQIINLILEEE